MKIKKGDFVKINYTGSVDGNIFDTTIESVGKAINLDKKTYEPITICVGEKHLIPAIDDSLIDKEKGSFELDVTPEKGFGKKNPKLLQLTPLQQFKKQNIKPYPGMELNIDGQYGIIRTISGGRVVVDYNHPLAGKDLHYDIEIIDIVFDLKEQINSLLNMFGFPYDNIKIEGDQNYHLIITAKQLFPQEIMSLIQQKITSLTSIKTVSFQNKEKPKIKINDKKTDHKESKIDDEKNDNIDNKK